MIFHYGLVVLCIAGVLGINNSYLREGDNCQLPNDKIGICRKMLGCPQRDLPSEQKPGMQCQSTKRGRVVCCPTSMAKILCESVPMHFKNRIIFHVVDNPRSAHNGEFPFMGSLIYDTNQSCGAALITKKHLLTAAHCFKSKNPTQVRLGSNSATDSGFEPYDIEKIVRHPDYKPESKGNSPADIAIVELREEVDFDDKNAPLCLYESLEDLSPNEDLTAVGWGLTDTETYTIPDTLMKGTVRMVPLNECKERYKELRRYNITSNHICAQGDTDSYTEACVGDSGNPLVNFVGNKYVLVGIDSTGHGSGLQRYPGVYTRVASYVDWITDEVKKTKNFQL